MVTEKEIIEEESPTIIPTTRDDDDEKPDTVVEDVVEEEIEEPVEEPWTLPEHELVEEPVYDPSAVPAIKIDEAPVYQPTAEEEAWKEMHAGEIQDIIKEGGRGIPEETQQLMKQQIYDDLRTRETENLRLLRNEMERRGITNSGLLFSEEQKIRSTTTRALAASVTEIKIKSAFMKIASYENALGLSAQFLGYLQEQSRLVHETKMATWSMRQQAKIVQFQANMEVYKMKLHQAYTQNNMYLQQQLDAELNEQIHEQNVEIAQMEIDAAESQAKAEATGNIIGTILGGITSIFV